MLARLEETCSWRRRRLPHRREQSQTEVLNRGVRCELSAVACSRQKHALLGKKYLEASNVCPNPLRPHRPHRPQRFVHTAPALRRHYALTAPTAHRLHSSAIVPTWPSFLVRVFKSLRFTPLPLSPFQGL